PFVAPFEPRVTASTRWYGAFPTAPSPSLSLPDDAFASMQFHAAVVATSHPIDVPSRVQSQLLASSIARRAFLRARDAFLRERTPPLASTGTSPLARPFARVLWSLFLA